jgi:hypothetical protein
VPNVRGDVTPLVDGMRVTAVNTVGGLKRDRARFIEWLAPFLPVGFYYKAFHGRAFPRWEQRIRSMSGLGAIAANAPRMRTPKRYAFCDVLVIGAGASGLAAALSAADAGARVLLVDENVRAGGCGRWSGASAGEIESIVDRGRIFQHRAADEHIRGRILRGFRAASRARATRCARAPSICHRRDRTASGVPQQHAGRDVRLGRSACCIVMALRPVTQRDLPASDRELVAPRRRASTVWICVQVPAAILMDSVTCAVSRA